MRGWRCASPEGEGGASSSLVTDQAMQPGGSQDYEHTLGVTRGERGGDRVLEVGARLIPPNRFRRS